jgi:cytidine deaminase
MEIRRQAMEYLVYPSGDALGGDDAALLRSAREATVHAYAPYSGFFVAAAGRMANGDILTGTNQENASFPAGLCAERALLSVARSLHPDMAMVTMAIAYRKKDGHGSAPVAPCGICRQVMHEFEEKMGRPVRLILAGESGEVYVLASVAALLPLAFRAGDLA